MNSREQFEKWSQSHYVLKELSIDFEDGEYVEPEMQYAYESWEASREALPKFDSYLLQLADDLKESRLGDVNQLANGLLEYVEQLKC